MQKYLSLRCFATCLADWFCQGKACASLVKWSVTTCTSTDLLLESFAVQKSMHTIYKGAEVFILSRGTLPSGSAVLLMIHLGHWQTVFDISINVRPEESLMGQAQAPKMPLMASAVVNSFEHCSIAHICPPPAREYFPLLRHILLGM